MKLPVITARGAANYIAEAERRHEAELADSEMRRQVLADRVRSQGYEIERCRREHTNLAVQNSGLQITNVQLAARLEQAELRLAQRGLR